ncbi:unnamed protein product [Arctia plantaginis]|uniref:Uncharacterized protein n=1 Tax=Arctia plantaginis TaxID=874455 RepID=A0A8S0YX92_ARCPL|nr:unnamed protein product [Arctia plantaginis]
MVLFFCRSPQIFVGWADVINENYGVTNPKYILDSAVCSIAIFIMLALPSTLDFFKHFTVKYVEDIPKKTIKTCIGLDTNKQNNALFFYVFIGGRIRIV